MQTKAVRDNPQRQMDYPETKKLSTEGRVATRPTDVAHRQQGTGKPISGFGFERHKISGQIWDGR